MSVVRSAREGGVERGAERLGRGGALVAAAVQRGGMGEVEPVRRRDVLLERRALARHGRKWKMPPPSLSSSTIGSGRPSRAAGQQAAHVVRERDVADQQHDRPACGRGGAVGGRDRAVDPVGAAVREHAGRRLPGREEGLHVAHRHRRGDHERRLGRQAAPSSAATRGSLSPAGAERFGDRAPPPRGLPRASAEPLAVARPAREPVRERGEGRPRVAGDERRDRAGGVLPGVLGIEGDLQLRSSSPCSHWRSGLDVGRSPTRRTRSGRCAAAQAGSRSRAS